METQSTVNAWQRETFGPQTDREAIMEKLSEELWELNHAVYRDVGRKKVAEEMADVCIVLWQLAGAYNIDLTDAVASKMAVNRARRWNVRGDGTAQHVPGD